MANDQQKKEQAEIIKVTKERDQMNKKLSKAKETIEEKLPKMEQTIEDFFLEVFELVVVGQSTHFKGILLH
ncbi:unnamed protein product [Diamesa tonsa]